jgi:hypothetical protein
MEVIGRRQQQCRGCGSWHTAAAPTAAAEPLIYPDCAAWQLFMAANAATVTTTATGVVPGAAGSTALAYIKTHPARRVVVLTSVVCIITEGVGSDGGAQRA